MRFSVCNGELAGVKKPALGGLRFAVKHKMGGQRYTSIGACRRSVPSGIA
jgi:hypothetical protein